MKNIKEIGAIFFLLMLSVFAYALVTDTFTVGLTEETLTFDGDENITRYISLPLNSLVTNFSVRLIGENDSRTLYDKYRLIIDLCGVNGGQLTWGFGGHSDLNGSGQDLFTQNISGVSFWPAVNVGPVEDEWTYAAGYSDENLTNLSNSEPWTYVTDTVAGFCSFSPYLQINLSLNVSVDSFGLGTRPPGNAFEIRDFRINASRDGVNWVTLIDDTFDRSPPRLGDAVYFYDAYTFPTNVTIFINDNENYTQSSDKITRLNSSGAVNVSLNVTAFNSILDNGCICSDCVVSGDYCEVPVIFHSDTLGNMSYSSLYVESQDASFMNISIYDAETSILITENISVEFKTDTDEEVFYTDTGLLNPTTISRGINTITFDDVNETGYSRRSYTVTISNKTTVLRAYLEKNTSTVTFTVADRSSSELLEGVLGTMFRFINDSYTVIEAKTTDVTGRIVFNYQEDVKYRFLFTATGYQDYLFTLDPVLFSEYDIKMDPTAEINESQDYDRISLIYAPRVFYQGDNNFTFVISSPFGELTQYAYSLSYPGGDTSESGSNSIGESLASSFSISGATSSDVLVLKYNYTTDLSGLRSFSYNYPIIIEGYNQTMIGLRDETYGMGIGERLLIATLIAIIVVGIATLIGRPVPGLVLGLFGFGYLTYIGFIPWWSVAITLLVGIIFLGLRGET